MNFCNYTGSTLFYGHSHLYNRKNQENWFFEGRSSKMTFIKKSLKFPRQLFVFIQIFVTIPKVHYFMGVLIFIIFGGPELKSNFYKITEWLTQSEFQKKQFVDSFALKRSGWEKDNIWKFNTHKLWFTILLPLRYPHYIVPLLLLFIQFPCNTKPKNL